MKPFTKDEDLFLQKNYLTMPQKVMARQMGRLPGQIARRLKILGLKVPPEIADAFKKSSLFAKGHVPENKGKKMPAEVYEKVKSTFFTKGRTPHNTRYDGHERFSKDGYWEIRIGLGRYVLKHRLIWEQQHGKVPKGMVVAFKDRNQNNIDIANLELITRQENMARNTIHRYPPELKSSIRLLNKLKRKIHEK